MLPRLRPLAPLRRAKAWFNHRTGPQQVTIVAAIGAAVVGAVIAGVFGVFTTILTLLLSHSDGPATAQPTRPATVQPTPKPTLASPTPIPLTTVLAPLGDSNPEVRRNEISALKLFIQDPAESAQRRQAVLQRLASFVRDHAPALPTNDTLGYCLKPKDTKYPTDAGLALEALGARMAQDASFPIDLSRVNLAYSNLRNLDLRNANFDGALLCRTFLQGSRLNGATFEVSTLRFSFLDGCTGLIVPQLDRAYTLYKTTLPTYLASSVDLKDRVAEDPDLGPR